MAFKKDPNAILDYTVDWTAYLTPIADTISTVTWTAAGGVVVDSSSFTASKATAFVSGGTEGTAASVTCRIVTFGGRTDDRTINLTIVNR